LVDFSHGNHGDELLDVATKKAACLTLAGKTNGFRFVNGKPTG
jgi:hypothetical protein